MPPPPPPPLEFPLVEIALHDEHTDLQHFVSIVYFAHPFKHITPTGQVTDEQESFVIKLVSIPPGSGEIVDDIFPFEFVPELELELELELESVLIFDGCLCPPLIGRSCLALVQFL